MKRSGFLTKIIIMRILMSEPLMVSCFEPKTLWYDSEEGKKMKIKKPKQRIKSRFDFYGVHPRRIVHNQNYRSLRYTNPPNVMSGRLMRKTTSDPFTFV